MAKIEYSDFYKFLASLGVVLISLALLLPWLFLREPFDIAISVSDLKNLTPTAQSIIATRQTTALWFLQNITWVSTLLLIGGFGFLTTGISLWAKRQKNIDQKENLEIEKLKRELDNMTPTQIIEKIAKEATEEMEVEGSLAKSPPHPMQNYFRIEEMVISKLSACFGQSNVLPNRRIRDRGYDVILVSDKPSSKDVIFEIKTTSTSYNRVRIFDTMHQLTAGIHDYTETTGRKALGIILIILTGNEVSARHQKMADEVSQASKSLSADLKTILLTEEELSNINCKQLKSIIFSEENV